MNRITSELEITYLFDNLKCPQKVLTKVLIQTLKAQSHFFTCGAPFKGKLVHKSSFWRIAQRACRLQVTNKAIE